MATLYVNASTGDDSRSYATAQNSTTPWQSIARATRGSTVYASPNAAIAAQAGDTVLVAAGVYTIADGYGTFNTASITSPALAPVNSGTAGNLITIRGVGTVEVRMGSASIYGPMIGSVGQDYIVWDNFYIDDYYGRGNADAASVAFATSDYCELRNCTILGHTGSYYWGQATYTDNYAAVWLQDCTHLTITDNLIHRMHDNGTGVGGQSTTGITTYDVDDSIIEHNEIYDVGQGIIIKGVHGAGQQANNIVRYNYIHDNDWGGIRVWLSQNTIVHNNIVVNSVLGLFNTAAIASGKNNLTPRFINNTLYGNTYGIFLSGTDGTDAQFHNNIVSNGSYAVYSTLAAPTAQAITLDRNYYHGYSSNFAFYEGRSPSAFNFATWQGYGAGFDANSTNGTTPSFSNTGGSFALAGDFKLAGGSSALTAGRVTSYLAVTGKSTGDTIPSGAYITGNEIIGITSSVSISNVIGPVFLI